MRMDEESVRINVENPFADAISLQDRIDPVIAEPRILKRTFRPE